MTLNMGAEQPHYRHLFFDLDNTVWDFNRNSCAALEECFPVFGLEEGCFEAFFTHYNRHNDALWELYRQNGITKQELSRARFDLTLADLGITGIDGLEFNQLYLSRMPLQTRLCDGAGEVLTLLAQKYQMHIITNGFSEVQYKKLTNSGLDPFFGRVFVSEEIKSPKPSPEIFRHALKTCNARKKESLMIGDSWEVDILGAMSVGIDQIHYAPFLPAPSFTPEELQTLNRNRTLTRRINKLTELLPILL